MSITALSSYKTVYSDSETEFIEKKSRFIGRCFHVESENDAIKKLEQIRKENWDATHNCYAYILKNGCSRFSDDGEPSGTAGMPIIETMKHSGVTDALVIVTRYFGGILLGTGGLVRAYSKSAADAITAARIVQMIPCNCFSIKTSYSYWNVIKKICEKFGSIENTSFSENIECLAWVKIDCSDKFMNEIVDKTDGRILPEVLSQDSFPFFESGE